VLAVAAVSLWLAGGAAAAQDPLDLYEAGRLDEARELLESRLERDAEDPAAAFDLGVVAYRQGDFPRAAEAFSQAARSDGLRARALYNAGCTLYRMGRYEEAVEAFRQALLADPTDEDAKVNLEFLLRRAEADTTQALPRGQKGPSREPERSPQEGQEQAPERGEGEEGGQGESSGSRQPQEAPRTAPADSTARAPESPRQPAERDSLGGASEARQPQPVAPDSLAQAPDSLSGGPGGRLRPEDVARIIENLASRERTIQAERLKARMRSLSVEKDW
jgi:tetratricopeptide (TPR) repeat protein